MSKSQSSFFLLSLIFILFIWLLPAVLYWVALHIPMALYQYIFYAICAVAILFSAVVMAVTVMVFRLIHGKTYSREAARVMKQCIGFMLPYFLTVTRLLHLNWDDIVRFYINLNNRIVIQYHEQYRSGEVLLLLPHCLQHPECTQRITSHISQCKECGKCSICELKKLAEDARMPASVVNGGTAARNVVLSAAPRFVVSVACERDLYSGMMELRDIPVIGVINTRPNGPCVHTLVDTGEIRRVLEKIIAE